MINKISMLEKLLNSHQEIRLYGAGYYLDMFLKEIQKLDERYLTKVKCIMVSDTSQNPAYVKGIPVVGYREANLQQGDLVLLTLGKRFTDQVIGMLSPFTGDETLFELDFNMFHEKAYQDVKKSVQPVLDKFYREQLWEDNAKSQGDIPAWTCWWQGEEHAPEIVRTCIKSQRRNLPEGVKHIVVTAKNYRNYICLPEFILKKVERGDMGLAHLSDLIRVKLLYQYGGFWMDADAYLPFHMPQKVLEYPFYTRSLPETQFYTDVVWCIGFLYVKPGNKLFHFLQDCFQHYSMMHDKLNYYFTLDYMIAVACNEFADVKKMMKAVPCNNDKAFELVRHLSEPFDKERYQRYVQGTSIQFLTENLGTLLKEKKNGTVYERIVKEYT